MPAYWVQQPCAELDVTHTINAWAYPLGRIPLYTRHVPLCLQQVTTAWMHQKPWRWLAAMKCKHGSRPTWMPASVLNLASVHGISRVVQHPDVSRHSNDRLGDANSERHSTLDEPRFIVDYVFHELFARLLKAMQGFLTGYFDHAASSMYSNSAVQLWSPCAGTG